jgi:hypothetical protein
MSCVVAIDVLRSGRLSSSSPVLSSSARRRSEASLAALAIVRNRTGTLALRLPF